MNRRILKKKIDAVDRILVDGLSLFAESERVRSAFEKMEYILFRLACAAIDHTLSERIRILPGPYHGCEMDPPRAVEISMPDPHTIHASCMVMIRQRNSLDEIATESFRLSARKTRGTWRMKRVWTLPVAAHIYDAAEKQGAG